MLIVKETMRKPYLSSRGKYLVFTGLIHSCVCSHLLPPVVYSIRGDTIHRVGQFELFKDEEIRELLECAWIDDITIWSVKNDEAACIVEVETHAYDKDSALTEEERIYILFTWE